MRAIPEMTVVVPADGLEMEKATRAAYEHDGPVYLRVGKLAVPDVTAPDTPFEIGRAVTIREGGDITLISMGHMLSEVLAAADRLAAEGVDAEVLNVHTVKPIDVEAVVASATKTGCVVTAEEHSILGGLGSAVAEVLAEHAPTPMERIGTRDVFGLSGTMDELFDYFGLRADNIVEAACAALRRRR
jgi:transketolase